MTTLFSDNAIAAMNAAQIDNGATFIMLVFFAFFLVLLIFFLFKIARAITPSEPEPTKLSDRPSKTFKDVEGRFHSLTSPAVVYNKKPTKNRWFIHGVEFDEELWKDIADKKIKPKDILQIENVEQRGIAIKEMGYTLLLSSIKSFLIDEERVTINDKKLIYQVIETDLDDDADRMARFVKVQCPSTLKETILRVPYIKQTESCKGAIAWTFGEKDNEYKPIVET